MVLAILGAVAAHRMGSLEGGLCSGGQRWVWVERWYRPSRRPHVADPVPQTLTQKSRSSVLELGLSWVGVHLLPLEAGRDLQAKP